MINIRTARSYTAISLAAFIAVAASGAARASELYYTFSFTGDGIFGSGELITAGAPDPTAPLPDAHDILAVDGTVNDNAITGFLGGVGAAQYSADGYFIFDNDFYPAGSASPAGGFFDDDGLLFTTAQGSYNLFFDGSNYWDWADQGSGIVVSFSAVDPPPPIPEPSSGFLFAGALVGLLLTVQARAARL